MISDFPTKNITLANKYKWDRIHANKKYYCFYDNAIKIVSC